MIAFPEGQKKGMSEIWRSVLEPIIERALCVGLYLQIKAIPAPKFPRLNVHESKSSIFATNDAIVVEMVIYNLGV